MKIHKIKIHLPYFSVVGAGTKRYELRKNDRDYHVGDKLVLCEFNPDTKEYSGREIEADIIYMTPGGIFGLPDDMCILGLGDIGLSGSQHADMLVGTINIKKAVSNDRKVSFVYYRDGELWYKTEDDELFPVPISDIGNATFLATDKAMLFMRYMRKWNDKVSDRQCAEGD